eukprot:1307023-Ditylum_brightwellii.AAC.1
MSETDQEARDAVAHNAKLCIAIASGTTEAVDEDCCNVIVHIIYTIFSKDLSREHSRQKKRQT